MLIVLTGKTASGKDTVMSKLLEKIPGLERVVSTTSRSIRSGETNGVDYNFISKGEFKEKIDNNEFLEYVEYGGNFYGTEKPQLASDQNLIWRIDPSMAGKVKLQVKSKKIKVIYLTTDDETVLQRLKERGLGEEEIEKRMQDDAKFWQEYKDSYDFVVENIPGKLNETVNEIYNITQKI